MHNIPLFWGHQHTACCGTSSPPSGCCTWWFEIPPCFMWVKRECISNGVYNNIICILWYVGKTMIQFMWTLFMYSICIFITMKEAKKRSPYYPYTCTYMVLLPKKMYTHNLGINNGIYMDYGDFMGKKSVEIPQKMEGLI